MGRRQPIRRGLLLVSFLLFPITFYYFSPYLIIWAASEGIIGGSFLVFAGQFAFSLLLGRAFCGWVCPAGGLAECAVAINGCPAKGGRWNWIKYAIWLPWVILVATMLVRAGGIRAVDPLFQTTRGISIAEPNAYFVYYIVLGLILALSFATGKRAMCHYVCWMAPFMVIGTWMRNRLQLPGLRLRAQADRCIHCQKCSKACTMSLDVHAMVQRGRMENSECVLCGLCIDTCPQSVIHYAFRDAAPRL